jgi:adenine/guanine phosphoribosyltransferase-like PRPP-binding protein
MTSYRARIGTQSVELPMVRVNDHLTIALLMTIDQGVRFATTAGRDLAAAFRSTAPEIVVSVATLGIPVAIEVTRALSLDSYVILQKSRKIHLGDALREKLVSITSQGVQTLLLDRARIPDLAGRRTVFVDDVISTGASTRAALRLLDRAGADVVGIGALLTEGEMWRSALGERARLVTSLGSIPVFTRRGRERGAPRNRRAVHDSGGHLTSNLPGQCKERCIRSDATPTSNQNPWATPDSAGTIHAVSPFSGSPIETSPCR